MFADFLLPMLHWHPKDRTCAQKMLDHPWLKMPDNYNYKMNDLEYKKYKLSQTFEGISEDFLEGDRQPKQSIRQSDYQEYCPGARQFENNVSDLADSDLDVNGGDQEDNVSSSAPSKGEFSSACSSRSLSFTSEADYPRQDEQFNLNVSFTGGYVPNTDLSRVDKG